MKITLNVRDIYPFTFQGYTKLSPVAVYSYKQLITISKLFLSLISLLYIRTKQNMGISLLQTDSFITDSLFPLIQSNPL